MTNSQHHQFATSAFRVTATVTLVILAALAIATAPLASAQTFMFNRADFATGVGPVAVAVGDFNGDGLTDVVTANASASTVSVLLGHGDGTFAPHSDYAVDGAPIGIVVGDFNQSADSRADGKRLVPGPQTGNGVSVAAGADEPRNRQEARRPLGEM